MRHDPSRRDSSARPCWLHAVHFQHQFHEKPGDQVTFGDNGTGPSSSAIVSSRISRASSSSASCRAISTATSPPKDHPPMLYCSSGRDPTDRRDVGRRQLAHRAQWRHAGLGTCRLQRVDRLIERKVLYETRDSTGRPADRVDQEQRRPSPDVRSATTGSNVRTGPPAAIRLATCAGVGTATNASSGISTSHARAIAITTRIAPIDVLRHRRSWYSRRILHYPRTPP